MEIKATARLLRRIDLTKDLAIFQFDISPQLSFKPGQWYTLAFTSENGKIIPRPYSISSPPSELPTVDFFVRLIKQEGKGLFTRKLFASAIGDEYQILKLGGSFLLEENDNRDVIMVASGTGIGPFMSMIQDRCEKIKDGETFNNKFILLHGVRHSIDIPYKEEIEEAKDIGVLKYFIPTVSREEEGWNGEKGRVENLFTTGKIEGILNAKLDKSKHIVYLCGHPEMIQHVKEYLNKKGFEDNKDIKFEKYWSSTNSDKSE